MATIRRRTWGGGHAYVVDYKDLTGARRREQFRLMKEAKERADEVSKGVRDGTLAADAATVTVAEAADIWLTACEHGRGGREPVEAATLRQYRGHVAHHIKPLLGSVKLSRLRAPGVAAFRDELLASGRSRPLARKVLVSLRSILDEARARGLAGQNAARGIAIVQSKRHKEAVAIPAKAEIRRLFAALDRKATQPHKGRAKTWRRWRALIVTAALTGMRASELRGLHWPAVDLKGGRVHVRRRADEKGVIGPLKSAAARRDIDIPAALVALLREWRLECPPGPLVFPNWQGNVESHANLYRRGWAEIRTAAKLPAYPFHALRHFRASVLIAAGATPKEVQAEMGHATITMTFDTYGHLFPEDRAARRARAETIAAGLIPARHKSGTKPS